MTASDLASLYRNTTRVEQGRLLRGVRREPEAFFNIFMIGQLRRVTVLHGTRRMRGRLSLDPSPARPAAGLSFRAPLRYNRTSGYRSWSGFSQACEVWLPGQV